MKLNEVVNNLDHSKFVKVYTEKLKPHRLQLSILNTFFGEDKVLNKAGTRYVYEYDN